MNKHLAKEALKKTVNQDTLTLAAYAGMSIFLFEEFKDRPLLRFIILGTFIFSSEFLLNYWSLEEIVNNVVPYVPYDATD